MSVQETKAIKAGSCERCWPFLCDPDLRACQGTCGGMFRANQLRRRAYDWFCLDCDAKRDEIYRERGVGHIG